MTLIEERYELVKELESELFCASTLIRNFIISSLR